MSFQVFLFWLINTSYFIQNGEQKQYVYCPLDRLHDDFSRKDVFVILSSLVVKSKESFLPFSWPMGRLRECQAGALKVSSQSWPQEQTWSPGRDVAVVARATCCPHLSRCQTCCLPVITDQRQVIRPRRRIHWLVFLCLLATSPSSKQFFFFGREWVGRAQTQSSLHAHMHFSQASTFHKILSQHYPSCGIQGRLRQIIIISALWDAVYFFSKICLTPKDTYLKCLRLHPRKGWKIRGDLIKLFKGFLGREDIGKQVFSPR